TLLPLLAADELGDNWTLVTDDILPDDLRQWGHIDGLLRRVVAAGVPGIRAVRQASLVPARHYGLFDRGAVATGYRADIVVVDDLKDFRVRQVFKNGMLVAQDGKYLYEAPASPLKPANTIHPAPVDESAFTLALSRDSVPAIRIIPGQLLTKTETQTIARQDGHYAFDPTRDVQMIASIERHKATGKVGLGLVAGFKLKRHG